MNERDIFLAALERESAAERDAFIAATCGQDAELRCRVEQLLKSHRDAGSFLEHPAIGFVGTEASTARGAAGYGPALPDDPTLGEVPFAGNVSLSFLQPCDKAGCLGMIGLYEITEIIGRGGMGVVLRGHDTRLNRVVAIKVLSPQLSFESQRPQTVLAGSPGSRRGQPSARRDHSRGQRSGRHSLLGHGVR